MVQIFNNKTEKLWDDLKVEIKKNSKLYVAAAIFSIYGFDVLKNVLSKIDSLQFIFTDPTFVQTDKDKRQQKKFEINTTKSIQSISWSDFEIHLKNEMKWRAIAKECKKWIENKVKFKTNKSNRYIQPQIIVDNSDSKFVYSGLNEFSSAWFGYENDNAILRQIIKNDEFENTKEFLRSFQEVWNDESTLKDITGEVLDYIANLYKENSPDYIYYITLYNIFDEFLEDISEDEIADEKIWFKDSVIWNTLYDFQKDAVCWIINKLERYNWCILADSVWLWKTFTALAVMKYYQERNKSILVLCPKKLSENRNTYKSNYKDNILLKDRLNYTVLFHTDLSRTKWYSGDVDLSRINRSTYNLVVIDESHNFRNKAARNDRDTRYSRLMEKVMKAGVKTKVLMLSATPVNNRFTDLKNQLALAYEWETSIVDEKMWVKKSIDAILTRAQQTFNERCKLDEQYRTSAELLRRLWSDFDFFKLLDSVTIARSRKHIERYYDMDSIWRFPTRKKPINIDDCPITNLNYAPSVKDIADELTKLNMSVYSPFDYILVDKIQKYEELYDTKVTWWNVTLKQSDREKSLQILMRINFLKRLESSVESFRITLQKVSNQIEATLLSIANFEKNDWTKVYDDITEAKAFDENDYVEDDELDEDTLIWKKVKIDLKDMNIKWWKRDLEADLLILKLLLTQMKEISPENDLKLQRLKKIIAEKVENPINGDNKKVIVFSAFADTVDYLYRELSLALKVKYNLDSAKVTWRANDCTLKISKNFNDLLMNFSPISKHRKEIDPNAKEEIEVLFATDCISEWQNLQDCDYLVNYDIHWNPVRIIQRFWRIDRIWSKNKEIQLVNFWPNIDLDSYIDLKNRVENRWIMVGIAWAENDMRKQQLDDMKNKLEQLKEEVIDIEDIKSWINITDLWLNDFRMDLVNYIKEKKYLKWEPTWMHTVCKKDPEKWIEEWVIYVLKNRNNSVNIDNTNQLHPFYLVYIKDNWEILSNHLEVKQTLDILRSIARWKTDPIKEVYEPFNDETEDGRNMDKYSYLLSESIKSIINVKDEALIDSLFSKWWLWNKWWEIKWIEDFELISFIVIK